MEVAEVATRAAGENFPVGSILFPLVLVVSAAFATLVPARRAMFVNPADVMRAD